MRPKSTRYRDDPTIRFYSRRTWRGHKGKIGVREYKLRQDPLCEICLGLGLLIAATEVHHEIEVREDSTKALDLDNLTSLCGPCHSRLTASRMNA